MQSAGARTRRGIWGKSVDRRFIDRSEPTSHNKIGDLKQGIRANKTSRDYPHAMEKKVNFGLLAPYYFGEF